MHALRSRAILVRVAQITFGLVLGLLLTEAFLQVGARFTRSHRGDQLEGALGDDRRVVFLGDSNTFGLGAGFDNSYPQVLQKRWNETSARDRVKVFNLGTPGLNSSKLRQQLPGILMALRPDALTIMIGVNDLWTAPAPLDGAGAGWHYRLSKYSRVYRFLYMLAKVPQSRDEKIGRRHTAAGMLTSVSDDVALVWTGRVAPEVENLQWKVDLQDNLDAMIADARRLGIDVTLLTYPHDVGWYGGTNDIIRATAARTQTPIVDLGVAFRKACPEGQCPELLLPDQHPTVIGHQLAADVLWKYFSAAEPLSPNADAHPDVSSSQAPSRRSDR